MKRVVLVTWVSLWSLSQWLFAQHEPEGLLLYQEPGTSSREAIEYRLFHKDNALYSSVIAANGKSRRMKSSGVLAVIDYPGFTFDDAFPEVAGSIIKKIQAFEGEFPDVQKQLEDARGKWDRALSVYSQTHKPKTVTPALRSLDLRTAHYTNVRLISATYDSATISHAGGVARIPLVELTVPQIVSLNSTSPTTQLGTNVLVDAQAVSSESPTIGTRINIAGSRILAFIAARTGIRVDNLHAWVLFVMFPALALILLIRDVIKNRKLSRVLSPPTPRPIRPVTTR